MHDERHESLSRDNEKEILILKKDLENFSIEAEASISGITEKIKLLGNTIDRVEKDFSRIHKRITMLLIISFLAVSILNPNIIDLIMQFFKFIGGI